MSIAFTRWPEHLARRYRELGYWQGLPLTAMLDRQRRERGEAIAIVCGERAISYAELDRQSTTLASHLVTQGLQQGDTALVQLPNVAEFYVVFFALLKAGIAPVNALYSHQLLELRAYARQIRPALWISDRAHPAQAPFSDEIDAISERSVLRLTLGSGDDKDLGQLIATPASRQPLQPSPADEVAFFQLSGGSTGTPKLIPRTHDDYYYSVRQSNVVCRITSATRYLCALPAGHNYPLSSPGALGIFDAGGTVVLARGPEALHCFELIARHRVTMAALVPSAVLLWLEAAPAHREKLASLTLLQVGGASFAESTARRVPAELGCALQQVFGMAEGLVNYTRLDDDPERIFATQGRPMCPDDEISIRDENGLEVADGVEGLLHMRGPYTFRGYFESPQHNARVFDAEGFYCSGDVVVREADGSLRVVGRIKDQINRGGEKIAAEEIENLLREHPAIHDAALIALPDALLGEKSCAVIVAKDPALRLPGVRRFLRELGLADYKLPDRIEHRAALPLTAVGKIDKKALRLQLEN